MWHIMNKENLPFYILFMLLLIMKTIDEPVLVTLSPADLIWPAFGMGYIISFTKKSDFRGHFLNNAKWILVIMLFISGVVVSVISFMTNTPYSIDSYQFMTSLIYANVKNLLIVGYFTLGIWASKKVRKDVFSVVDNIFARYLLHYKYICISV